MSDAHEWPRWNGTLRIKSELGSRGCVAGAAVNPCEIVGLNPAVKVYVMELSEKNAAQYLKSRGILAHRVTELGGGISNVVLLVETGEESFILKQSLSQLRVKDQWLADRSRIFREMESLIDTASILPRRQRSRSALG